MKILILGGNGMLGNQLLLHFEKRFETRATLRKELSAYSQWPLFTAKNTFDGVDFRDFSKIEHVLKDYRPDVIFNASGIVKQNPLSNDPVVSIEINSLLPHRLSLVANKIGSQFVQISTDCVFSGAKGVYLETDTPDPTDMYGKTKALSELSPEEGLTIRTSYLGLELGESRSLIGWFLKQKGTIKGFTKAIYTGLTTMELARVLEMIITKHPDLRGLWHVAGESINKYDLLNQLSQKLERKDLEIIPDQSFTSDRSLSSIAFKSKTGYEPPSWDTMLTELAQCIKERRANA